MKTYTKANKLNFISIMALLWLGSFGVFGQVAQQPEWKWQNPLPTSNLLWDVNFVDTLNGWSVGSFGTILKTTDGGTIWTSQTSGTYNDLLSVNFISSQTGWISGDSGTILKTSNGGLSWEKITIAKDLRFRSIFFINETNGWIVGKNHFGTGKVFKTTNGGNNWLSIGLSGAPTYSSILFTDTLNGFIVASNGLIIKTTNGGVNWNGVSSGTSNGLLNVFFLNKEKGWIVGENGTILKTVNAGLTWQNQSLLGSSSYITSVNFIDEDTGWITAGQNILKTSDGGETWVSYINQYNYSLSSKFINSKNGIAVGSGGLIMKTGNGGETWQMITDGYNDQRLYGILFSNSKLGWVSSGRGIIYKTYDGGKKWLKLSTGIDKPIVSIKFFDPFNGLANSSFPYILLKTTNGGSSWNQIIGSWNISSSYFVSSQLGWAVNQNGSISKTVDGGFSWQPQVIPTQPVIKQIKFFDAKYGWALSNLQVFRTNDGGATWQNTFSATREIVDFQFIDSLNGWIGGRNGMILRTNDGGINWLNQHSGTTSHLITSLSFIDSLNGWASCQPEFNQVTNGLVTDKYLVTTNGGNSWESKNNGLSPQIKKLFFLDKIHGWAIGEFGTILTTITNNPIDPESPTTLLTGNLFEKTTANCNTSQVPVPNRFVKAEPGPYYGISDNQGKYNLRLPLSDTATPFTLHAIENSTPTFNVEVVCPPNNQYNITLDTIPDTLTNKDFGFEITPCHHLNVQIASNRRRRCFKNTTSISYQNQGSLSAPDAYLLVEFPHWVRPVSASRSFVAVNDSIWRFNLDTVSAGESGSFTITDSVICGNLGILGLSQCTKATIFPAPDCPPPPGYNGAEVTVSGKCNDGFVSLGIYNKTNTDMADSVNYWVYLDSIQIKQAKVKLVAGDSLKLWVESNDLAVHLTVNQVANHPTELFVSTTVESCGDTFIFYPRQMVNRFAKQQRPNSKTHCLPVIGSYDPNDKQAFPIGFTNQNIIPPNTQLEYLVRFQNTGNDTAFTVYVIDTLDTNLNPETIELGAASHNYQLSMQTVKSGKTFLRWQFNNIQLPDSNVNEPASNGFIQFRISPKANLALGSKVRNHAEIYFDFNPPIITNQTLTTYNVITFRDTSLNNNVQIVTATKGKLSPNQIGVNLYPNPVTEHSLTADFQAKGSLTLFNAQGQLVFERQNIEGKQVLPIQLKTGFYMAQLRTEKGVSVVKVVVE